MQLGEIDFRLLELLTDGRVTPEFAFKEFDGEYTYEHVCRRLSELADTQLVERVADGLYEATWDGARALRLREKYESRDDVSQAEFYHRLHRDILDSKE